MDSVKKIVDFIKQIVGFIQKSVKTFATNHPKQFIISVLTGAIALVCLIILFFETRKDDENEDQNIIILTGILSALCAFICLCSIFLRM